jgi:hypothetical protein
MYKYIFITIILLFRPFQSNAQDNIISNYEETIRLTENGDTQVSVEILISSCKDSVVEIPLNFAQIQNLNTNIEYVEKSLKDETIPLDYYKTSASSFIRFNCGHNIREELILKMDFLAPEYVKFEELGPGEFDSYIWNYRFKNLSRFTIENYNAKIILPKGYNYHKVTESIPKFTKKNPTPPYKFETIGEDNQIIISSNNLYFGDNVFIDFIFKSNQKSYWILVVGGIFIALYLFFFRDVWKNAQQRRLKKIKFS